MKESTPNVDAARAALQNGEVARSEANCRLILAQNPRDVDAMFLLADIYLQSGRSALALQTLRSAVTYRPDSAVALLQLARLVRTTRRHDEAIELCRRAIELAPEDADARFVQGICFLDRWHAEEAIETLTKAIEIDPNFGKAYNALGRALSVTGREAESIEAFRSAARLMPEDPAPLVPLAHTLIRQGDPVGGEQALAEAQRRAEGSREKLGSLARTLQAVGYNDQAADALREVIKLAPDAELPRRQLALILQQFGQFEEAAQLLTDILSVQRGNFAVYHDLAFARKITLDDRPLIEAMDGLAKRPAMSLEGKGYLHYALGKAHDDLEDYGVAMAHFHEANRLSRSRLTPELQDGPARTELVDSMISGFTPEFFRKYNGIGADSAQPVFIVGMPRSGTTLTEQIVSCHPQIGAVGEHTYLSGLALEAVEPGAPPDPEKVSELAQGYLRQLGFAADGEPRLTDKMPNNYLYLGIIHLVFPNARIIHCRRNPVDTCLSIYVTPITVDFSHSLESIAFSYREYQRLMDHWRRVIPPGRFLDVDYEDLVANPEPTARRMIDFIGLPWNDAVLHPEFNTRAVITASKWQVRQPLHTRSVERWRRYEPWIGELLAEFPELTSASTRPHLL